jgi:hypothetical protein
MSPSLHESTITTLSHCHDLLGHLMVHYADTEVPIEDLTQARQALTILGGTLAALATQRQEIALLLKHYTVDYTFPHTLLDEIHHTLQPLAHLSTLLRPNEQCDLLEIANGTGHGKVTFQDLRNVHTLLLKLPR